jgi:signal transduction histidine kinase
VTNAFKFRPSARLQRYLGRELIADPNVAILEFVKNAYDAGASTVRVDFSLSTRPSILTIADDGIGMDVESFEANWMRPGFSEKGARTTTRPAGPGASTAERHEAARVPVGEKGIGRLAAGRLGEKLEIFTRRTSTEPWLHVDFDWSRFDDMNRSMDEIEIPFDLQASLPNPPFPSGTVVVISDLSQKWEERIRGRALRGRRRTRLGRLKQDLEFLIRPMSAQGEEFRIVVDSDMVREPDDVGEITPASATERAEYSYSFRFTELDGRPVIIRKITRSPEAAALASCPELEDLPAVPVNDSLAKREDRPDVLTCGPFEGRFLYNPPPAARRAREIDESPVGVLLYRDGVLVEPYGLHDDDWLGVRARKAQRQGHAAIQPDTFFGHVLISREGNPELRDQTNRLGLLDNPESETFLEHVIAEFRVFEEILYSEILEPRWEGKREDEAARLAQEGQERASILLRSLAHSLRQPLQGLGWELVALKAIGEHPDLPAELKAEIEGVAARIRGHVELAEGLIRPLLTRKSPDFARVEAAELMRLVLQQTRLHAEGTNTLLRVDGLTGAEVLVPPDLVVQAIAAVVTNAIEAPRPPDREHTVEISVRSRNGDVAVLVVDNGEGIAGADTTTSLGSIESTKGRPAAGLQNAEMAVVAAHGRIRLVETGPLGTTFEIVLPTRTEGVKRQPFDSGD